MQGDALGVEFIQVGFFFLREAAFGADDEDEAFLRGMIFQGGGECRDVFTEGAVVEGVGDVCPLLDGVDDLDFW